MLIYLFNYVKFFTLKINEDKSFKRDKREKLWEQKEGKG